MQPAIGFTFTALLASSLTLVSTLAILVPMFLHLRRERDVALLLIFNTYLTVFAFSLVLLSTTVNVLRADLFGVAILSDLNTTGCRFQGLLLFETFGCCYLSFVLQAFYRLTRVIYPKRKFLQVCPLHDNSHSLLSCTLSLDILVQSHLCCSHLDRRSPAPASRLLLATAALLILPIRLLLRYHIRQNRRFVLRHSDHLFPAHRLDHTDLCSHLVFHPPSDTSAPTNGTGSTSTSRSRCHPSYPIHRQHSHSARSAQHVLLDLCHHQSCNGRPLPYVSNSVDVSRSDPVRSQHRTRVHDSSTEIGGSGREIHAKESGDSTQRHSQCRQNLSIFEGYESISLLNSLDFAITLSVRCLVCQS